MSTMTRSYYIVTVPGSGDDYLVEYAGERMIGAMNLALSHEQKRVLATESLDDDQWGLGESDDAWRAELATYPHVSLDGWIYRHADHYAGGENADTRIIRD